MVTGDWHQNNWSTKNKPVMRTIKFNSLKISFKVTNIQSKGEKIEKLWNT